ncbi:MAG: rRNA pseudouridine synthase [Rickettsiales bacterium]|nr:rRNA pseudouridine synthase [Rickettsiales bacterium]
MKNSKSNKENQGTRVAKLIASLGHCSRRQAEELIFEGRVKVNGNIIDSPATFITDEAIKIDDKLINKTKQTTKLWIFYKGKEMLTTNKDPSNRPTIFDFLPKELPRVMTVGRLDFNTEGLLLLTNNGGLARYMELPKNKWIRKYRARVFGKLNMDRLNKLEKGITVDGIRYGGIKVEVESQSGANSWLKISLSEGKNREIRKVMEHLGLSVNRLIRVSFGPFNLGNMKPLEVKSVSKSVLASSFTKDILG